MANIFKQIMATKPKYSNFDLTHDHKLSGKMGHLMPTLVMECVPGDNITIGGDALIRFAPLLAPAMHRYDVFIHYFFVPNRILWDGFQDWVTNKEGAEAYPQIEIDKATITADQRKFLDYMGVPPDISTGGIQNNNALISALPFAAYQAIYNEYYRDQNLIAEVDYKVTGGTQTAGKRNILWTMRNRAWEHDYFTSALPFAQKGDAVDIPIGLLDVEEPVLRDPYDTDESTDAFWLSKDGVGPDTLTTAQNQENDNFNDGNLYIKFQQEIEPTTINDLRRAFRLQEWFEKMARGGSRYIEQIYSHFGVKSPDARLQRPEYITGVKAPIVISEVLNTTGNENELPQGNMAGHGAGVTTGKFGRYKVYEHGWIIGILSVRPKTAYMQGIPKHYLKNDPFDLYWPSFAHIGEQEVKVQEVFAYTANADETFGYVPRYAEYKYMPSRVSGEFRTSLDYWHGARKFSNTPALNQEFIECTPDQTNRIFAVLEGADHLYCHVLHKIKASRPMPVFGTPMI